jgi:predicted nicotinamide N-methyase
VTAPASVPLVPELSVRTGGPVVPLWHAVEAHVGRRGTEPPFWGWPWPGSIALARVMLDGPVRVRGRRVLDFGAGCGLATIAALRAGAAHVIAAELDPLAAAACHVNAWEAGVAPVIVVDDLLADGAVPDVDLLLAGDVCYDRGTAATAVTWLRRCAAAGVEVLLADPGRAFAPVDGVEPIATFDVPVPHDLESVTFRRTTVMRVHP